VLNDIEVSEVWGVGRKHSKKLEAMGIKSVLDLALSNPQYIEQQFSVVMKRTVLELTGTACIELEQTPPSKKQIISSKSFGQRVTDLDSLREAVSSFLQSAVKRLRKDNSLCGCVIVSAESNKFDANKPFYRKSISIGFAEPTDSAAVMIKAVIKRIDEIYKEGIEFKKCGVILTGIEPKETYIHDLLADLDAIEVDEKLQTTLEDVKEKFGDKILAIGPCKLPNRGWSMSRNRLTQNYFSVEGMLTIE